MGLRASAPGKTILMGEHAAVYQRPALVAAVDRRLSATFEDSSTGVVLDLPQVQVREETTWDSLAAYARDVEARWRAYEKTPTPENFQRLRGDHPAHLVKIALGEAVRFTGETPPPVHLHLDSQIPIGAGFGSSAAAAVALVGGFLAWRGVHVTPDELHRLTLEVERRQHGTPSGIDNATVIHGGLVWAWRDPHSRLQIAPLVSESPLLQQVQIFNTGEPAETTGDVVASVRRRIEGEAEIYEQLLDRMESATIRLRDLLTQNSDDLPRAIDLFREFEGCLEQLGVVPEPVRQIVRRVEARGGAAKISGAGALTGQGAGSLLVLPGEGEEVDLTRELMPMDVQLGADGLQIQ